MNREKRIENLVWNVYTHNFNTNNIEVHNIFNHSALLNKIKELTKKYKDNKEEFEKELKSWIMYYYWSKCEWEVIITSFPAYIEKEELDRLDKEVVKYRTSINLYSGKKIDVYDQIELNWDIFFNYVWATIFMEK